MRLSDKIAQSVFTTSLLDADGKYFAPHLPGVYKFTNLINKKVYVGMGMDLYARLNAYKSEARTQGKKRVFIRAVLKYGWDNFKVEFLEIFPKNTTKEIVLTREMFWISFFQCIDKNFGYNCIYKAGGTRHKKPSICGPNDKRRRSHSRKLTPLARKKISESMLGDKHYARRIGFTEEHKKNLSIAGHRRIQLPESRVKISESKKKQVDQLNAKTGELIKRWKSSTDAAIELFGDISIRSAIAQVLIGRGKTCRGFGWRRVKDEII